VARISRDFRRRSWGTREPEPRSFANETTLGTLFSAKKFLNSIAPSTSNKAEHVRVPFVYVRALRGIGQPLVLAVPSSHSPPYYISVRQTQSKHSYASDARLLHIDRPVRALTKPVIQRAFVSFAGYEMSRIICQNRDTGAEVDADLCPGEMPHGSDLSVECNSQPCPPK